MSAIVTGSLVGLAPAVLWILCFYFTLSFFENLKKGNERLIRQSKFAAVVCMALAILAPVVLSLVIMNNH